MTRYAGVPGVPGHALGRLHRVDRPSSTVDSPPGAGGGSPARLAEAFDAVVADLDRLAARLRAAGRAESADIVEANRLIAADPDLRADALAAAASGEPAPAAVSAAVDRYAALLAALPDPTLAARATDVRAVGRRLLARLAAGAAPTARTGDADAGSAVVLVGKEVAADDLLSWGTDVIGVVSVVGGPAAHTAIVARSLRVPVVFGVDPSLLDAPDGAEVAVDGTGGLVVLEPTGAQRDAALAAAEEADGRRRVLAAQRFQPPVTRDGRPVGLLANVADPADSAAALAARAEGVGLVRTEMPFLAATHWPTYEEHLALLRPLLSGWANAPVTVRTLDFADDKLPPFLRGGPDAGPLGRGLPLLLARPREFGWQLRAILRAGAGLGLRVLIPMVSSVDELRACRALLAGAARAEDVSPPPLGAMVELPEAVARIAELAAEADFLSIGSNDLTASLLGLSRRDPALTPERAAEPVVLRAIAATVDAADRHGRTVSVCGDAAAAPATLPLLVGLGVTALSVAPAALDEVRAAIRALDTAECRQAVRAALRT
jgi:phosphoenolpyruvate-protein kinase (PTS system EI component)